MKKCSPLFLFFLLSVGLSTGCKETDPSGGNDDNLITSNNSQIIRPTVWKEGTVKVIDCILSVQSILTIEPGCTLQFTANGGIEVGMGNGAALVADGTSAKPITFTSVSSANAQAGSWYGIVFGSNTMKATTKLNNCIVEGAGKDEKPVIELLNTTISMDSCIVRNAAGVGIKLSGSSARFTHFSHNVLSHCSDFLLFAEAQPLLGLDTTNVFTSVVNKYIALDGGDINTTGTLKRLPVSYTVLRPIRVDNAELTIQPGCSLRFTSDAQLEIGYYHQAALIAEGEPDRPIVFTSAANDPQAGDWNGIYFSSTNLSDKSIIKHAVISYGGRTNGSYEGAIVSKSHFKLLNTTIRQSKNYGVVFSDYGGFVECANNTIQDCGKDPIYIGAAYVHTIGTGNAFFAGQGMGIHVHEGIVTKNVAWLKHSVPYIMEGEIFVQNATGSACLTLAPGCDLRFMAGSSLVIDLNAQLLAIGTVQDSIFFTSNAQTKAPADWDGIKFWQFVSSSNELKYCRVDYAGHFIEHNIGVYSSNVKITHCAINHARGNGIYIGHDETAYLPVIQDNTYFGNEGQDVFYDE